MIKWLRLFSLVLILSGASGRSAEPLSVYAAPAGRLHLFRGEEPILALVPVAADAEWKFSSARPQEGGSFPFVIDLGGKPIEGSLEVTTDGRGVTARYVWRAREAVRFETLTIAGEFETPALAGGTWEAGGRKGTFPARFDKVQLFAGEVRDLRIVPPGQGPIAFSFSQPTFVLLQDDRNWGETRFTLRIGRGGGRMEDGETFEFSVSMPEASQRETAPAALSPWVGREDAEWIPLAGDLEIVPGSALDLAGMGFIDGPCGERGRVVVTPDGHFAFADDPATPRRFYGVNFCFSAQFLPKDEVDRLLDRIVRLGYNSVRIHHYETGLTTPEGRPGFDWDPVKVDQLDYLLAACARRGLWVTTDLYVSRPVSGKQLGRAEERIEMDRFKILVPVDAAAFADWKEFARRFLDRVNPHTGKRLADDPAIAWLSLINEGPVSHQWTAVREVPEWQAAWNRWLEKTFPDRATLAKALGDLAPDEPPGAVRLPPGLLEDRPRSRLAQAFVAETERDAFRRMRTFLREDLGCAALLTNLNNAGPACVPLQLAREEFDYVDEHFYVDHPRFLEKPWRLPSASPIANPVVSGATGGTGPAAARLFGKPFTITEYNYAGPGRFRGVGGILTAALASLQDWDGLWRFAYSHSRAGLFEPEGIDYFDLVSDPLNQAADRLSLLLFLRRDLPPADARIAVELSRTELENPPPGLHLSPLQAAAWMARIGSVVTPPAPRTADGVTVLSARSGREAVSEAVEALAGTARRATEAVRIDPPRGVLVIDTPRSAGGYAEPGETIDSPRAGVEIGALTQGATVFVTSLEDAPIRSAHRLLVTHLTDLQNTGIRYGEGARKTLLGWGGLPYLVRDGSAEVRIALPRPDAFTVWALSPGGRRMEKAPSRVENGRLVVPVRVKGPEGARMLYEITSR